MSAHGDLRVESAARVLAVAALVAYAVGLLTVNAYLNRIGIADFTQLRARFALTGTLVLLSMGAAFLPARAGWLRRSTWPGRALLVLWPVVSVAAYFAVVSLDKGALEADEGWGAHELRFALLLELGALVAGIGVVLLLRERMPIRALVLAVVVLAGAAVHVQQFGRHVYPRIPIQNGGGEAICATLVTGADAGAGLRAAGVPYVGPLRTAPVPIAYEGDDFYVVGLGVDRWLRVRRDLVDAVLIGASTDDCLRR
jgi:hypothetical protein